MINATEQSDATIGLLTELNNRFDSVEWKSIDVPREAGRFYTIGGRTLDDLIDGITSLALNSLTTVVGVSQILTRYIPAYGLQMYLFVVFE